jgi:curved DNA-binding protein CbpA
VKISEAYQVLSDPELRKSYNELGHENGLRPDGGFGKMNKSCLFSILHSYIYIVDPEQFFKQSFGGDRFVDMIGEISIGKDMQTVLETEEEGEVDLKSLTLEQKSEREEQKREKEQERAKVRNKRVDGLCVKLINKLSLYTELNDTSEEARCAAFSNIIQIEAEDLKKESHGVELLNAIGYTYLSKAEHYLARLSVFGGFGGMFHSVREKSYIISETVGTLRSALDLQTSYTELQKAEERGDLSDEQRVKLETEAATKVEVVYY